MSEVRELMPYAFEKRPINIVRSIAKTIDDLLYNFGLGRPLESLMDFLDAISPHTVLTDKLGIPAPGDIATEVAEKITYAVKGGRLPRPEELIPLPRR